MVIPTFLREIIFNSPPVVLELNHLGILRLYVSFAMPGGQQILSARILEWPARTRAASVPLSTLQVEIFSCCSDGTASFIDDHQDGEYFPF